MDKMDKQEAIDELLKEKFNIIIEEYLDYKNNVQQFEEADYYADLK